MVVVPRRVEQEALQGAWQKVLDENVTREAIVGGMKAAEAYEKYIRKLTLLHKMLFFSMKTKQTTDLSNVEKLRTLLSEFRDAYFEHSGHKH